MFYARERSGLTCPPNRTLYLSSLKSHPFTTPELIDTDKQKPKRKIPRTYNKNNIRTKISDKET